MRLVKKLVCDPKTSTDSHVDFRCGFNLPIKIHSGKYKRSKSFQPAIGVPKFLNSLVGDVLAVSDQPPVVQETEGGLQ